MEQSCSKSNGSTEEARLVNMYLKTLKQEVYNTHHEPIEMKAPLTAMNLKNKLLGIVRYFNEHRFLQKPTCCYPVQCLVELLM